jgi:2-C-methyl-D-erythritol 4-phosphate cytidylyltransferase
MAARSAVKKEYRLLPGFSGEDGQPLTVLGAAVSVFAHIPAIAKIAVTVPPNREDEARAALPEGVRDGILFVNGGNSRRASVYNALCGLHASGIRYDLVLIHDGARPWVSTAVINAVIDAAAVYGAAIPVLPVVETPKELDIADARGQITGFITRHPRRETVFIAQTPQGFSFASLLEAHEKAAEAVKAPAFGTSKADTEFTDDAEVWAFSWPDRKIAAVPGEKANKKITFPEDLA